MHIRKIYESFAVLEDIHRSADERMDEINSLESLSSTDSSTPTSSSDEKTLHSHHLCDDREFENLDLKHEDHFALFCRERLNHVTARTLNVLLMEMRRLDTKRDMILLPKTINNMMYKYRIPLAPSLKHLHTKFRDERFLGSTNYELMMTYLEARRGDTENWT